MANLGKVLAFGCAVFGIASASVFAAAPLWVLKNSPTSKKARVESVNRESPADLLTINSGGESMLQIGAMCSIFRGNAELAKIVVIEANAGRSVAMVLSGGPVEKGDEVGIVLSK